MRSKSKFLLLIPMIFISVTLSAQVTIKNIGFNGNDISGPCITNMTILNQGNEFSSPIDITLYDAARLQLMKVTTIPVKVLHGISNFSRSTLIVANVVYDANESAGFIKTFHRLPSGNYICCVRFSAYFDSELNDAAEFCEEQSVENDFTMNLISPFNEDIIETNHPLLIWTHNEPFTRNSGVEDYRIIVTELHSGQNPEAAIISNNPVFSKNNISSHSIIYPANAMELESGKKYAWQVTKSINGKIVNQTDVWEFSLDPRNSIADHKYGELSTTLNASYYSCKNGKVFFRFTEAYNSNGILKVLIKDKNNAAISPKVKMDNDMQGALNYKSTGSNAYEIDINPLHLKVGFYTLEVVNEKNEMYLLKFKVE